MIRAREVLSVGSWEPLRACDQIALPHDGRHRRRLVLESARGESFLLDLPEARALRDGDGLVLDDGRVVRVLASSEPVADVTGDPHLLLRVAWHIGNRHIPCQLLEGRIRIARDHVLEAMVRGLGAGVERVEAPFQPEPGAYAAGAEPHGAAHVHHHHHSDEHDHDHGHAQGDGHAHGHEHAHENRAARGAHRHDG